MFESKMYDGRNIRSESERKCRINAALRHLNRCLFAIGEKSNADFDLPMPECDPSDTDALHDEYFFGESVPDASLDIRNYSQSNEYRSCNEGQRMTIDEVMTALRTPPTGSTCQRLCFLKGAGGTDKTHVYKVLIQFCERYRIRCIAAASTGVAATLLTRGRAMHSTFKLSIDQDVGEQTPSINWNSDAAQRIRLADFVIIDEVSMLHRVKFNF